MPEAYFFADAGALRSAGCARQPLLVPDCDAEHFQTIDQVYLAAPTRPAPSWAIDPQLRPWHPKHYLRYLLEPADYAETTEGVRALQVINWGNVLANPQHTLFLRSLFQDLADALGLEQSRFPGDAHPLTCDYRNQNRLLRNL
jgi:hypothetical protein